MLRPRHLQADRGGPLSEEFKGERSEQQRIAERQESAHFEEKKLDQTQPSDSRVTCAAAHAEGKRV